MFAAFPPNAFSLAVGVLLLDTFLYTAMKNLFALELLRLLTVGFVEASAVDIGLPEQLAEICVGKIDTLFRVELRPFIWIISIDQRFSAFHAELDSFEGKLMTVLAHLFIVEVLVVVLVVRFFSD